MKDRGYLVALEKYIDAVMLEREFMYRCHRGSIYKGFLHRRIDTLYLL